VLTSGNADRISETDRNRSAFRRVRARVRARARLRNGPTCARLTSRRPAADWLCTISGGMSSVPSVFLITCTTTWITSVRSSSYSGLMTVRERAIAGRDRGELRLRQDRLGAPALAALAKHVGPHVLVGRAEHLGADLHRAIFLELRTRAQAFGLGLDRRSATDRNDRGPRRPLGQSIVAFPSGRALNVAGYSSDTADGSGVLKVTPGAPKLTHPQPPEPPSEVRHPLGGWFRP
jgi:hypothetical protein